MGECSQKWLDIFVTNADPEQEEVYDDQHVCAVQSVRMCHKSVAYQAAVQYTGDTILNPDVDKPYIAATAGTIDNPTLYAPEEVFGHLPYWTEPITTTTDDGSDVITTIRDYVIFTGALNGFAGTDFIFDDSVVVESLGENGATTAHPTAAGKKIGTYRVGDYIHDKYGDWIPNPLYQEVEFDPDQGGFGPDPDYSQYHVFEQLTQAAVPAAEWTGATIVEEETDWILPAFPRDHLSTLTNSGGTFQVEDVSGPKDPFADVKVGDLVRIGGPGTHGFTDYLTVVEKSTVDVLYNATGAVVPLMSGIKSYEVDDTWADGTTLEMFSRNGGKTFSLDGRPLTALRLNHSVNATTIKRNIDENLTLRTVDIAKPTDDWTVHEARLGQRHLVTTWSGEHLYPLYHLKEWRQSNGELTAVLDHGVKEIQQIKLIGYSLMNKRQVGPQHAHEMIQDDYLILRIKEVHGQVISNNRHANGAFAILYAGAHDNNTKGGADVHSSDPAGLVVQSVGSTNKIMRNLTVQVTDRTGQPAHFGRLHLWFKILATHG